MRFQVGINKRMKHFLDFIKEETAKHRGLQPEQPPAVRRADDRQVRVGARGDDRGRQAQDRRERP